MPEPINIRPGPKTKADLQADITGQSTMALTNLLETLGTAPWKEMGEYHEEVNKSKKEMWQSMGQAFKQMRIFGSEGGMMSVLGGSIQRIKDNLAAQIEGMLAPITNEISTILNDVLTGIEPIFNEIVVGLKSVKIGHTDLLEAILTAGTSLLYKNYDIIRGYEIEFQKLKSNTIYKEMMGGFSLVNFLMGGNERDKWESLLKLEYIKSTPNIKEYRTVFGEDMFW